jgi:hypothetical protein
MPTRSLLLCLSLLTAGAALRADEPVPERPTARGDRMLEAYFRREAQRLGDACLADVKTRDDWERQRPERRRQFLEMMGLWPLPPRTDLKPVVTGKVDAEHFTIEKLHFQSLPGLYVTADLFLPKKATFPAPAILYVCGHGASIVDKVSHGNKVSYQQHPAWYAEHGYVCLIVDSLELGEIQGIHHGTYRLNHWWWQTVGYTPAGVECWNGMRALDYLETRKEVDAKRLGVTGRSGGGATSWWVAAADERVQCIVPVAGITDVLAHVAGESPVPPGTLPRFRKGVVTGHCDCMYFVNTYRWDNALAAALCAPRPLLLGNSEADTIFPVPGYRRLADKVRKVYELYGAGDKFQLLETAGPHKDTPELRLGEYGWMNRWLKNDTGEVTEPDRPRFEPPQLKVFERPPDDAVNAVVQETFCKPAVVELPQAPEVAREWWKGKSKEWLDGLRDKVFHGWPAQAPPLDARLAADIKHDGLRLRAFDFVSEENVELRLWLLTAEKVEKPSLVVLTSVDETGWRDWTQELGPTFKEALQLAREPKFDEAKFAQNRKALEFNQWAFATLAPRGIGPTRYAEVGTADDNHVRRRFALLGQTLDGQRVWDVRRGLAALRSVSDLRETPLWLQGTGDMAGVVLYAALFEPDVARLDLWHPPASHRQGPIFLNVRRILDMPQAVALALPRKVFIYTKDDGEAAAWEWPLQLQKALGQEYVKMRPAP